MMSNREGLIQVMQISLLETNRTDGGCLHFNFKFFCNLPMSKIIFSSELMTGYI